MIIKKLLIIWFIQFGILLTGLFFGLVFDSLVYAVISLIGSYFLSFYIVNAEKKNIFNLPSVFLIGFGFLILGRFFGWGLSKIFNLDMFIFNDIFCLDFFFNYCLNNTSSINLMLFLNSSLVFFTLGFLFHHNVANKKSERELNKSFNFLLFLLYPVGLYLIYVVINYVNTAISAGYMALYASQAESYEAPVDRIVNAFFLGSLAVAYVFKDNKRIRFAFIILTSFFILSYLLKILTGARSYFIAAIIFLLWYYLKDKKIKFLYYAFFAFFAFALIGFLDLIAQASGAREINNSSFVESMANLFYNQGITLMVVNNALVFDEYPSLLGYLKTILPGIQIIYNMFGVVDRYLFDWSSYIIYKQDRLLYNQGYGLGWSLFNDLYYLAYKFLPVYFFLLTIWGVVLNYISKASSQFCNGLSFVFIFFVFSISRDNISPLIFAVMMYCIVYFLFTRKLRR